MNKPQDNLNNSPIYNNQYPFDSYMNMQKLYNLLNNNNNSNITIYNFTYILFIVIFGIAAAYYSFKFVNKEQNMNSRIFISIGAFFMNIGYFIKIIFLKLIGYKWYKDISPITNIDKIVDSLK